MKQFIYEKLSEKFNLSICNGFMHDKTSLPCCLSRIKKCTIWIHSLNLNLNLEFKSTQTFLLLVALAQLTSYCHVMIMHHIVHCIDCVPFYVAGICPLSIDVIQMMWSLTLMKTQCYLQKCQASITPCSFRYNPTLSLLLSLLH